MEFALRQVAEGGATTIALVVRRDGPTGGRALQQTLCRVPSYSSLTGWTGVGSRLFAVIAVTRHGGQPNWICVAGPIGPGVPSPYGVQHTQVPYYDVWTYERVALGADQPDDHSIRTRVCCRYCEYQTLLRRRELRNPCCPLGRLLQWFWRALDGRRGRATAHTCHPAVGGEHARPLQPGLPGELKLRP